jgi:hypothetical protein
MALPQFPSPGNVSRIKRRLGCRAFISESVILLPLARRVPAARRRPGGVPAMR